MWREGLFLYCLRSPSAGRPSLLSHHPHRPPPPHPPPIPTPSQPTAATSPAVVSALTTASPGSVVQLYRSPALTPSQCAALAAAARSHPSLADVEAVDAEAVYNIELASPLSPEGAATLAWLLAETYEPERLSAAPRLGGGKNDSSSSVVEVGPRLSFQSAWSTNAVSVCGSAGLAPPVTRVERSRRYAVRLAGGGALSPTQAAAFAGLVHDRMTEQVYEKPLTSFTPPGGSRVPPPPRTIRLLEEGEAALAAIDAELGLAFDAQDVAFYMDLFTQKLKRNPTDVELFDLAQSNSEHSRHWFFGARLVLDGVPAPESLMQVVKAPLKAAPRNSVIGFHDNSSAIRGGPVTPILPVRPGGPSPLAPTPRDWDILLTAETHNFPCAVAPYPGAETGAGGRIRDTHATGIGSVMGAATAGYCVGNLGLSAAEGGGGGSGDGKASSSSSSSLLAPSADPAASSHPWEDGAWAYPPNLAPPLQVLIDASNGASDYGNKFGEPLIAGYTRTFGLRTPDGSRREWIKPIMFSAGLGQIDHGHLEKADPEIGWLVVKIGGPAYRIGMGGGAASSVPSGGGDRKADLDFDAVQRGDAEMAQKLWRVVRACVELGPANPIRSIHDQGAGGNCNVVKEIIYPLGAQIDIRSIVLGDATMSVLEIWGAEYQENDCLLIAPSDAPLLASICERERCLMQVIGTIDGKGRVTVRDSAAPPDAPPPVDLDLALVLGDMPPKTFEFKARPPGSGRGLAPVSLPPGATPRAALSRVLRLPAVASKRFLTTKVDRSVTGLVARQQCVGPLQLPLADVAVLARTHTGTAGAATSIGEQPLKGLADPAPMARLALAEALTNLVWAPVSDLSDVKASVNWMYAAKMGGEGADMWAAATALRDAMLALGLACDGGKDSLSMAAAAPDGEAVMAPGNLVVSAYVACPDVTGVVTPDLKLPGSGALIHVDIGGGGSARRRLGGSALAHAYGQVGCAVPDVDIPLLGAAFRVTQALMADGAISAGHDISDGGLVSAVLEMAFAGNTGVDVALEPPADGSGALGALFAEEVGLVLEVPTSGVEAVLAAYKSAGVPASRIGSTSSGRGVSVRVGAEAVIAGEDVGSLRDEWEETAFRLEARQASPACVAEERAGLARRPAPVWRLPYTPALTPRPATPVARVAVLREEGSNGDREMAAALDAAGLEAWDVAMSDLAAGRVDLADFRGLVFVGGFSYADVLDSAKGWAGAIRGSPALSAAFEAFRARPDTWSLGVCNGCQLMALLGWVPGSADPADATLPQPVGTAQPRFTHNASGRFESRWSQVTILDSPAVLLEGMAGATMGVWCAHGEGKATFPDPAVEAAVLAGGLAPIRYADAGGAVTTSYPANPNGSPHGIAALCSPDGRHLAMMPHPERCFLGWQCPWVPPGVGVEAGGAGPWLRLFQNAAAWCAKNK
jgi:phosphoribosylformylglycinamidine synthase